MDDIQISIRENISKYVTWTSTEESFRMRYICYCGKALDSPDLPKFTFSRVLETKLSMSFVGCFLEHLNRSQRKDRDVYEEKLKLIEFQLQQNDNPCQDRDNDFCYDILGLLKEAVSKNKIINTQLIHSIMSNVRLTSCSISEIDSGLKKLKNLQVLYLQGNLISDVQGDFLPRTLKLLELYCNLISDVTSLSQNLPPCLLYLGLSRNKLWDGSNLHLLAERGSKNLTTLDLEENDICDLVAVLHALKSLNVLYALNLEGNPCSACVSYCETTLKYLPKLLYLDRMQIWPADRQKFTEYPLEDLARVGALAFRCFRLMGIPEPVPEKMNNQKVHQTYHLEVELPLLDRSLRMYEELPEPGVPEADFLVELKDDKKVGRNIKKTKKNKSKKESKKDKVSKTSKEYKRKNKDIQKTTHSNITENKDEDPVNEILERIKAHAKAERLNRKRFRYFKSERMPWSRIIEFPDPTLEVPAPLNDLAALRDTFRSRINVKIIFMKSVTHPEERVLQRLTLADFDIQLQNVNWYEKTVNYIWSATEENKRSPSKATLASTSILKVPRGKAGGDTEKVSNPRSKPLKPKSVDKKKSAKSKSKERKDRKRISFSEPIETPNNLTCQIGFGLVRLEDLVEWIQPKPKLSLSNISFQKMKNKKK